jgi:hypothetical protein
MAYDDDKATLVRERDLLLWLHAEAVWLADESQAAMRRALNGANQRIDELVAEKQSERSSRQAWAEEAGRLTKFRQMVHLLLGYKPDITADAEVLRALEKLALAWQRGHTAPWSEVEWLRREVEFEANADPLTDLGASRRDNLRYPLCACPPAGAVFPAPWTPPQCTVHPQVTPTSGDDAVTSVLPDGEAQ